MYQLTAEMQKERVYKSTITGTEIKTRLLNTDKDGRKWWAFSDLLEMPFIRKKAAEKVTNLYAAGLTKEDIDGFVSKMKTLLKSNDQERYEKAYSELLQLEALSQTTDPVKQSLGLCSVYILADDEQIDVFSLPKAYEKMELWSYDPSLQAFFLSWLNDGIIALSQHYNQITQIASIQGK